MIRRATWSPRLGGEQGETGTWDIHLGGNTTMRERSRTRRRVLLSTGTAAAVLAGGGVAFAYWTTSAAGTGTAAVASAAPSLTLHATTTGLLSPGSSVPVFFSADNASASGLQVGTVHLDSVSADSAHPTCSVADFSMPDVVVEQTIAAHATSVALAATGTLSYADTPVDQSGCKGASLTLTVSSR
jgi:hypothetical protein